jgi:hypothetical protein
MLESGPSGSVRGVPSNGHPYRDPRSNAVISQRAVSVGNGPESRRTVDQSMKSQKCQLPTKGVVIPIRLISTLAGYPAEPSEG